MSPWILPLSYKFRNKKLVGMTTNQFGKKGWTPDRIENLNGKTYVITGTTSGTGFEAVKILLLNLRSFPKM